MTAFTWTSGEVACALDVDLAADPHIPFLSVSTDTRSIGPGALFVALEGDRFDGHRFLHQAADAGARAAVVRYRPEKAPEGLLFFIVPDTRAALGKLGRHRRRHLAGKVVGVVGSNGKTTTKDLLRAALGARLRVHATEANLNNQVGVPLTLLAAPDDAEAVIVEMGTNEPGEISVLAAIVEPDAGVVTSIGEEHLEKLGDLEGVLREEIALLPGVRNSGPVFVAEEPPMLVEAARGSIGTARVLLAGFGRDADLHPEGGTEGVEVLEDGSTRFRWAGETIHVPLPGRHNVRNALLALGVARAWGVDPADAARGIAEMPRPKLRGEWKTIGGIRVLADCYNANPPGVLAALDLLASLPAKGPKIAVLGTMRELGDHTERLHQEVADAATARLGEGIDRIVATGVFAGAFGTEDANADGRIVRSADPLEAYDRVAPMLGGNETILLKASRGETLERWVHRLEQDRGDRS